MAVLALGKYRERVCGSCGSYGSERRSERLKGSLEDCKSAKDKESDEPKFRSISRQELRRYYQVPF